MQSRDYQSHSDNVTTLESSLPPNSLEAEDELIGAILLDGVDVLENVLEISKPEHFYLAQNRVLFQAFLDLYEDDQDINLLTVQCHLVEQNKLKAVGDKRRLVSLSKSVFSSSQAMSSALLVKKAYLRRKLQDVGRALIEASNASDDLETVIDSAEDTVLSLGEALRGDDELRGEIKTLEQLKYDALDEVTRARQLREERGDASTLIGFSTGLTDLDEMTGGLPRQELIIAAGRPSMGKSILGENITYSIAAAGHTAAFISFEQSRLDITRRRISTETGIPFKAISIGDVHNLTELQDGVGRLAGTSFYIDDRCGETVAALTARIKKIKKMADGRLDFVCIDYLQLMEGSSDNRVQDLSKITRALKKLARRLDICILCLSQLSRACESRNDKRPINSDLKESGAIEQDADKIFMLYRAEYYDSETDEPGVAEIIITKNRNGAVGTVKTIFEGHRFRFLDLSVQAQVVAEQDIPDLAALSS